MSGGPRGFLNRRMWKANGRPVYDPESLKSMAQQIEEESQTQLPSIHKEEQTLVRRDAKNRSSEVMNRLRIRNNPIRSLSEDPKTKGKLGKIETLISSKINENPSDVFSAYTLALSKIAQEDKVFGKLIHKIKGFFDSEISTFKHEQLAHDRQQLKSDILRANGNIEEELKELKTISQNIEKFSQENKNFKKTLHEKKDRLNDLKLEMKKIQNIDVSDIGRDPEVWEYILKTNKLYAENSKKLKTENKELIQKEKSLIKVVNALYRQGVNIEEFFAMKESAKESEESETQRLTQENNLLNSNHQPDQASSNQFSISTTANIPI